MKTELKHMKFATYLSVVLILFSCNPGQDKTFDEEGIADNAIDYELKEYDEADTLPPDSAAYAYDQPPTQMNPKTAIRDNVSYILEKDPLLNRYSIEIDVFEDTLKLKGEVYSFQEKQKIEERLSEIEGIGEIQNEIVIKNFISSPYQHPYQYYAYPTISAPELEPDEKIKEKIEHELRWSPFVNKDNIEVVVNNGNVTLTGTVDTRTEKKYAELNAVEGGAFTVENHLVVEYKP